MTAYFLRGGVVSLLVFLLSFATLWLAAAGGFFALRHVVNRLSSSMRAAVLYVLQIGPFLGAASIVAGFVLPSFLRFEPRATEEPIRMAHVALSLAALAFIVMGVYRAVAAYAATRRLAGKWQYRASEQSGQGRIPVLSTGPAAPPLVVVGVFRPKLLISASASRLLTPDELASAMAHEAVHARRYDNLKKLLLRFCCSWRIPRLEQEWAQALELSADERAVANRRQALDLASALIKVSRMPAPCADLAASLTAHSASAVEVRIERLLAWKANEHKRPSRKSLSLGGLAVVALAALMVYEPLLLHFHSLTELLMR